MTSFATFLRRFALLGLFMALAACDAGTKELTEEPPVDLGNFALGHNVVVAEGMQQGPFSRKATEEEVQTALQSAIGQRFGRQDGDKLYHLGLKVEVYALALPGVPVVLTPKSVLAVAANVWDDEKGVKLNDEPKLLTVFEGVSGSTIVGSGLTRRKDEQLEILSRNMARAVERWLLENGQWFDIDPDDIPPPSDDDPLAALSGGKQTLPEAAAATN